MITFTPGYLLHLVPTIGLPPGFKVDKNNLLALLKKLSSRDLKDKLLSQSSYERADLLSIVNDHDSLASLNYLVHRILYFFFNPQREWKVTETPLLEMHYMFARAEHILGLTDRLEFEAPGKKYTFKSDGEYASVSLQHITEHLKLYKNKFANNIIERISAAYEHSLSLITPCYNHYVENADIQFYERYKNNEMSYISAGWYRHGVSLVCYGDYLIYTNRGEAGDQRNGAKIYKIKNKSRVTAEFFKKIISDNIPNAAAFHRILGLVVDLDNPLFSFRCRGQRHPTCSFANAKSNVEPMLVLAQAGPSATYNELKKQYDSHQRRNYKYFTSFMRDREIDEIIKSMFYATNIHLMHFYAALAKKIIREHHGKNRGFVKDKEEIKRACDFYDRIPTKVRYIIDSDPDFVELIKEIQIQKDSLVYSRPSDLLPKTYFIRTDNKAFKVNVDKDCVVAINDKAVPKMHFSYKTAKTLIRKMI